MVWALILPFSNAHDSWNKTQAGQYPVHCPCRWCLRTSRRQVLYRIKTSEMSQMPAAFLPLSAICSDSPALPYLLRLSLNGAAPMEHAVLCETILEGAARPLFGSALLSCLIRSVVFKWGAVRASPAVRLFILTWGTFASVYPISYYTFSLAA